jgi:hypothetical protein
MGWPIYDTFINMLNDGSTRRLINLSTRYKKKEKEKIVEKVWKIRNLGCVEKLSVQILGTTDSQVVQQSYTTPKTHNQK